MTAIAIALGALLGGALYLYVTLAGEHRRLELAHDELLRRYMLLEEAQAEAGRETSRPGEP